MGKMSHIVAALAVTAAALAASPALAGNEGFETGGLDDWTVNTPFSDATNNYAGFTPVSGAYFAHLDAGLGQDVYSTLSQTFTLNAGDKLSGYAGFTANDYLPYNDSAYIAVNGAHLRNWSVAKVGDFGSSGWVRFAFAAQVAGDYTLELGVANHGDNGWGSVAVLDAVRVTAPGVPEPASWAMMVGGFGLIGGALRGRRRAPVLA